jgi:hypothetical protein
MTTRFQIGDECLLKHSHTAPKFSFLAGVITGGLEERDVYDDYGEWIGKRLGYRVEVNGEQVCAPPEMVVRR